jgi:hypothetical protein
MLLVQKCTEIFSLESRIVNKVIAKIFGHADLILDKIFDYKKINLGI